MALELLIDNGFNGVVDAITLVLNEAMYVERSRYLQTAPLSSKANTIYNPVRPARDPI